MSNNQYILDEPLPVNQDFSSLKNMGINYIQSYSGYVWNNLNPSDPGITILDQVCYALTELGYCNDFSINDILTRENGKIQYKNQFFLPLQILTTAPVTIADYQKYIIANVNGVNNVQLASVDTKYPSIVRTYSVWLYIDPLITDLTIQKQICSTVFYQLNQSRNVGDFFLFPDFFKPLDFFLWGEIEIEKESDINQVVSSLQTTISNFIFPTVAKNTYNQLTLENISTNNLYDGPYLPDGWIDTASLGVKQNSVSLLDLEQLIASVNGVKNVNRLNFTNSPVPAPPVTGNNNQILCVDIMQMIANGNLVVTCKGKILKPTIPSSQPLTVNPNTELLFTDKVDVRENLPKGKYRNISDYYSVQNTFPEIFGVGHDSVAETADDFRKARSKQLKGYLTLIDQVLSNQFCQLENICSLFSFENATTGAPSDRNSYYKSKTEYEKAHPEYPVPYRFFAPTYFYQSLYNIPYIKPLLKDNETFQFTSEKQSLKELEYQSWEKYKGDPYNAYVHGLMEIMEDEQLNAERRNQLLDHLLARHGESPAYIDSLIHGSVYAGNSMQDKIIFKSLYLQNLDKLTYNRHKAYDYISARQITGTIELVTLKYLEHLREGNFTDYIVNTTEIDLIEKISEQDICNYSALELKLSMLLGLKNVYKDFIALNSKPSWMDEDTGKIMALPAVAEMGIALWMLKERKGLILIESRLLLQYIPLRFIITTNPSTGAYYEITNAIDYFRGVEIFEYFQTVASPAISSGYTTLTVNEKVYDLKQVSSNSNAPQWIPSPVNDFFMLVKPFTPEGTSNFNFLSNRLHLVLPYLELHDTKNGPRGLTQFNDKAFLARLSLFLQNEVPIEIGVDVFLATSNQMLKLIPAFTAWHNSLAYRPRNSSPLPVPDAPESIQTAAQNLLAVIDTLTPLKLG
ncbi:MAG TPA: hypothetical protein VD905_07885 [Flavobacteriales bacterium]|nr:hypothetical protein [Flavobacteriales bacterium]